MNLPAVYKKFNRQNEEKVEKQNLTYQIFKDIDYTNMQYKTSFYRSDFRGSRFENIVFYENNFDIADFINNVFINVEFSNVIFGEAEVKNCVFKKCRFNNNHYQSVPYTNCTFIKCDFTDEEFKLIMKDCSFQDCSFTKCKYNQCSTDTIEFINCTIIKCEMSTMHAENYKIVDCIFRDTYLGINFLGTYLIKGTDFNLLGFKYRGDVVPITDARFFNKYIQDMYQQYRYYEYLNLIILFKPNKIDVITEASRVISNIINIDNENYRLYTLKCIFEMLEFYLDTEYLAVNALCNIIVLFEQRKNLFKDKEILVIECGIFRLLNIISTFNFSTDYLAECNPDELANAEFTFDTDDIEEAKSKVNFIMSNINSNLLNNYYELPYTITSIRKGSVIITITSFLMLILLAAKILKSVCHTVCKIKVEIATSNKMLTMIENTSSSGNLVKTLESYSVLEKQLKSDDLEITNLSKFIIQLISR